MAEELVFDASDITNDITQEARDIISDVVLSWARFDSLVTYWVILSFGMDHDAGAILLGNMDTRTKLDRLKALHQHFNNKDGVKAVATLAKSHKDHAEVRNAVAHKNCAGLSRRDPERLIFTSAKPVPGLRNAIMVELIHFDQLRRAIAFAKENGDALVETIDELSGRLEALRAPSDVHGQETRPNPHA